MESKYRKIKQFLESGIFNKVQVDSQSFINFLKSTGSSEVSLLYGETYDKFGVTIDSLKYYAILECLVRLLKEAGCEVTATLLVGDIASVRNSNVFDKGGILRQINDNVHLINELKTKYGFTFKIEFMSERFKIDEFSVKLNEMKSRYENDSHFRELLIPTVLQNRVKQEIEVGFQYSLEEIAIISAFDIKIGPPREQFYDNAANYVNNGKKTVGMYVMPTFPLGMNYDYFINHPEIEEFGITPYKAGSNKFEKNRIILNATSMAQIEKLIDESYVPVFEELPNPVLDVCIICDLANRLREDNLDFSISYFAKYSNTKEQAIKLIKSTFYEYF